jgi:hypothetical protein
VTTRRTVLQENWGAVPTSGPSIMLVPHSRTLFPMLYTDKLKSHPHGPALGLDGEVIIVAGIIEKLTVCSGLPTTTSECRRSISPI